MIVVAAVLLCYNRSLPKFRLNVHSLTAVHAHSHIIFIGNHASINILDKKVSLPLKIKWIPILTAHRLHNLYIVLSWDAVTSISLNLIALFVINELLNSLVDIALIA